MRRNRFVFLLLAAVTTAFGCTPTYAQGPQGIEPVHAQQQVALARVACRKSFADIGCATSQTRVIKAVAEQATAARGVSSRELSNRQLDELIAAMN